MQTYICDVCKTPCSYGQKFCNNCGKKFNWGNLTGDIGITNFVCDVCKAPCSRGQKFCSNCGKKFNW